MADVLTISGSAVTLANFNATLDRCSPIIKDGIPELHFSRFLGTLKPSGGAALPDVWSAQPVTLTTSSVLIFSGDTVGYIDRYMESYGWLREYRALGLLNRADYIPVTDSETLTDTAVFNLPGDDPNFTGSRAGLTVGQICSLVLTGSTVAAGLSGSGVGAYVSLGIPAVLPALTVADLAALTVIPQAKVSISGERVLSSLIEFVKIWHPNHWLHVQPDGTIRFLDQRLAAHNTLTLGGDPRLGMPQLTRDYADCYSRVEVRGNVQATPMTLQTLPWPGSASTDGGLQEDFAWGSLTNAAAKAAWVPADYNQPILGLSANDMGTCTCPDTLHVIVTDSSSAVHWTANFWNQANAQGQIYVYADTIPGISQFFSAKIVANTALTAGGTSTLTLDRPLPNISFNSYQIWGLAEGESVVYRRYKVSNTAVGAALLNYFPYPVAIKLAVNSAAASLTSTPAGFVQYFANGVNNSAGINMTYLTLTVDPVNGIVYFDRPTAIQAGTTVVTPYNVIVFLPVATGTLSAFAPSSTTYSGTSYTVEGIQRTKIITVLDWLDFTNQTTMQTFANEYLTSVQDVVVEGSLPYLGLLTTFLTVGATGQAVSIAGTSGSTPYTTGWESLSLPVVSVEILYQSGPQGTSYVMNLGLSNRRGRFTADNFLRPGLKMMDFSGNGGESFGGAASNAASAGGDAGASFQGASNPLNAPDPGSNLPAQWDGSMPGLGMSRQAANNREANANRNEQNARDQQERQGFATQFGALPGQDVT